MKNSLLSFYLNFFKINKNFPFMPSSCSREPNVSKGKDISKGEGVLSRG